VAPPESVLLELLLELASAQEEAAAHEEAAALAGA